MLPTEVQRIVLLIGLAATAYLLILAWNDDYIATNGNAQVTTSADPLLIDAASDFTPVAAEVSQPTVSDVPDDSLIASQGVAIDVVSPQQDSSARLIKIRTPELLVWLDRLGGDVVRVELPKFPLEIDRPDIPYRLLDNGAGTIYVAQSGLIGEDGIDSGGERPLYSANASSFDLGDNDTLTVELTAQRDGLQVSKIYQFRRGDYLVDLLYRVRNNTGRAITASLFAQIKRDA
ncbi:MAG: membrane protein insertase YidC, partial [Gammaproteobacteria bacterium]|nr:membrane protein insertase YidC [Gammaproteobacteria bacterium]